ncbi:MAG: polymer-forming cytoskeletal protein [Hyphomicrobium sp.]
MFSRDSRADTRAEGTRQPATVTPPPPRFSGPMGIVSNNPSPGYSSAATADRPTSILGPDISIFGQQLILKTKGSLLIQGHIEGDVHGETVTVDEGAHVKGVITARTIAIQGGVKGQLKGSNVILHEHSVVDADIVQERLTVSDGAHFEGSVKKAKDVAEVTPDLS